MNKEVVIDLVRRMDAVARTFEEQMERELVGSGLTSNQVTTLVRALDAIEAEKAELIRDADAKIKEVLDKLEKKAIERAAGRE